VPSPWKVPTSARLAELLTGLLGKRINAKTATMPLRGPAVCAAVYVAEEGTVGAYVVCDPAFAAWTGGALSLMPPAVAGEGAKTSKFTPAVMENYHEVVNICASLLLVTGPHIRLASVHTPPAIPATVTAALTKNQGRADFDVEVPGYGTGKVAFILA
jgi:hypothetical protein